MWRERKTDARRRGDIPPMAGGIPRPRQGAPGTARGQGASRGNSSDGLVIATFEAVAAGAAAAARAAGAFPGGTRGADHSRALRAAAATAATAAGAAAQLLACHVAWPSEAEAGPRKAPPPCPKASPADEAAPSPGRGSARTVSRRMRRTGARDAAGRQAEAEVAEGGAEESASPATSDAKQDVRHESQIPAEHRQPDTDITSGGGDEPDGEGTDSASSWGTVEDDGGAEPEGRWKAAVVIGTAADGLVAAPPSPSARPDREVDGRPGDGGPRPRGPVGRHARRISFVPGGEEETTHHRRRRVVRTVRARVGSAGL